MNVLVLGGTSFVGRHIVTALLGEGHGVSIFTRGRTNPELFPEAEHLIGDRDGDLSSIRDTIARDGSDRFDACVDVSGYTPAQVDRSLDAVAPHVGRYLFISTVSVYRVPAPAHFTEEAPVEPITNRDAELSGETYGMLKVACEEAVRDAMGDGALIFRLGLVNGPWDPTDRATSWTLRAAQGGEIFVPAGPETPFQVIDARDIGRAACQALAADLSGTYNIVGDPVTWREWLETSREAAGGPPAEYVWADDQEWVEEQADSLGESRPRGALPMFLPERYGWGFWNVSNERARAAGMEFRQVGETIEATLAWRRTVPSEPAAGLTPEQESTLIERWRAR